jgi:hypothetical protein
MKVNIIISEENTFEGVMLNGLYGGIKNQKKYKKI